MRGAVTTGDQANDLRLADLPPGDWRRRNIRLNRIRVSKAAWWRALQERDDAEGILKSCGGRGVVDRPPPYAIGLQQGPATTFTTPSLPRGGTDGARGEGNVSKPEMGRESAPRPSPPQVHVEVRL